MIVNPVSSLFLIHVLHTLDDTVTSRKAIMNELIQSYETGKENQTTLKLYVGLFQYSPTILKEGSNQGMFYREELDAFAFNLEHSTSKKEHATRRVEILDMICGEVAKDVEENMGTILTERGNPMLYEMMAYSIEQNSYEEIRHEFYRLI